MMGFQLIGGKTVHIKRSDTPDAAVFAIYGESLNELKLAYMSTGNGVGFELFQFIDPPFEERTTEFEYHCGGFFHVCVTDSNPEALTQKVLQEGGSRVGISVDLGAGISCRYVKDPWGNVVEILDTSFERLATALV